MFKVGDYVIRKIDYLDKNFIENKTYKITKVNRLMADVYRLGLEGIGGGPYWNPKYFELAKAKREIPWL